MLNLNICSPCNNIRGEAQYKCADERADLLGGPQPPPLLLIQAFLPHTVKVHTGTIICPGGRMGTFTSSHKAHGAIRDGVGAFTALTMAKYQSWICVNFKDGYWIEQPTNE